MLLDAMGKVDAGEEGRWREETYKERLARETGAKKGNMKASHAEVEVVEVCSSHCFFHLEVSRSRWMSLEGAVLNLLHILRLAAWIAAYISQC
jgi:hypothetical protein